MPTSSRPPRAAGLHVHEVTPEVLAAMCDTAAPQGLLAVCRVLDVPLDAVLDDLPPRAARLRPDATSATPATPAP